MLRSGGTPKLPKAREEKSHGVDGVARALLRQSRQRRQRRARTARLAGLGRRLWNQVAVDNTRCAADTAPVLVLDSYEHTYHLDVGANTIAYIDAVMRTSTGPPSNANPPPSPAIRRYRRRDPSNQEIPSISVDTSEIRAELVEYRQSWRDMLSWI